MWCEPCCETADNVNRKSNPFQARQMAVASAAASIEARVRCIDRSMRAAAIDDANDASVGERDADGTMIGRGISTVRGVL